MAAHTKVAGTISAEMSGECRPKMKINLRQEIAMWVLGLLWTALGIGVFGHDEPDRVAGNIVIQLILLVPACLIIFSLRTRPNPGHTNHE